jgi:hypothetical protein
MQELCSSPNRNWGGWKLKQKSKTKKNKKQKTKEKFKLTLCLFLIINPIQNICGLGLVVRTNVITCTCTAKFFFKLINEIFFKITS